MGWFLREPNLIPKLLFWNRVVSFGSPRPPIVGPFYWTFYSRDPQVETGTHFTDGYTDASRVRKSAHLLYLIESPTLITFVAWTTNDFPR